MSLMSISSTSTLNASPSMTSSVSSWSSKSKQNSMHEFIRAVREYHKTRAHESVALINRHLQLLGVSIETSIFDPNTSVVCEFFVSMYDLLSFIEPRSSLSWGCVNVLQTACKNPAARHQLIHTYHFIPLLSRILGDHLALDKKLRLLPVIQELSCGLKISWIIPNLEHLMSTLLRWVQNKNENEQVVLMSLGIIVNLCFKNLPATYMLSKCVDIKKFLEFTLTLKGIKLEACACKLFIILDYVHGIVPHETFLKLLELTFKSVRESFAAKDPILLRQDVEFYLDVKVDGQNLSKLIVDELKDYPQRVFDILFMITQESDVSNVKAAGDCMLLDPECMSLIFKFLKSIVDWNLPKLDKYYDSMTLIALNWIQTEIVASDALCLIKSILSTMQMSSEPSVAILEAILGSIPILILNLQNIDKDTIMNIDQCMRLSTILELLKILVRTEKTRERVIVYLSAELLENVFNLAMGNANKSNATDANNFTPEAFALYIKTLSLLNSIAQFFDTWKSYLNSMLERQQMHAILAECLLTGSREIRTCIFEIIAGNANFPCDAIAGSLNDVGKDASNGGFNSSKTFKDELACYPWIQSHSSAPEDAIRRLNDARTSQRINISTCDVMELYEYKIATMGHAERAAIASVEAASARCTHLQHQVAQLTAELSRIRQLFLHTQQVNQDAENSIKDLQANIRGLRIEKDLRKQLQGELNQLKSELSKKIKQNEALLTVQEELQHEVATTKNGISKMQESMQKMERAAERKEEIIKNLQFDTQAIKTRLREAEVLLKTTESQLDEKHQELNDALKESEERRKLLDTIMKLSISSNKQPHK